MNTATTDISTTCSNGYNYTSWMMMIQNSAISATTSSLHSFSSIEKLLQLNVQEQQQEQHEQHEQYSTTNTLLFAPLCICISIVLFVLFVEIVFYIFYKYYMIIQCNKLRKRPLEFIDTDYTPLSQRHLLFTRAFQRLYQIAQYQYYYSSTLTKNDNDNTTLNDFIARTNIQNDIKDNNTNYEQQTTSTTYDLQQIELLYKQLICNFIDGWFYNDNDNDNNNSNTNQNNQQQRPSVNEHIPKLVPEIVHYHTLRKQLQMQHQHQQQQQQKSNNNMPKLIPLTPQESMSSTMSTMSTMSTTSTTTIVVNNDKDNDQTNSSNCSNQNNKLVKNEYYNDNDNDNDNTNRNNRSIFEYCHRDEKKDDDNAHKNTINSNNNNTIAPLTQQQQQEQVVQVPMQYNYYQQPWTVQNIHQEQLDEFLCWALFGKTYYQIQQIPNEYTVYKKCIDIMYQYGHGLTFIKSYNTNHYDPRSNDNICIWAKQKQKQDSKTNRTTTTTTTTTNAEIFYPIEIHNDNLTNISIKQQQQQQQQQHQEEEEHVTTNQSRIISTSTTTTSTKSESRKPRLLTMECMNSLHRPLLYYVAIQLLHCIGGLVLQYIFGFQYIIASNGISGWYRPVTTTSTYNNNVIVRLISYIYNYCTTTTKSNHQYQQQQSQQQSQHPSYINHPILFFHGIAPSGLMLYIPMLYGMILHDVLLHSSSTSTTNKNNNNNNNKQRPIFFFENPNIASIAYNTYTAYTEDDTYTAVVELLCKYLQQDQEHVDHTQNNNIKSDSSTCNKNKLSSQTRLTVIGHSFGSCNVSWLVHTSKLKYNIETIVLLDPVSILLSQPDVMVNFLYKSSTCSTRTECSSTTTTNRLVRAVASSELFTETYLRRHFAWYNSELWLQYDLLFNTNNTTTNDSNSQEQQQQQQQQLDGISDDNHQYPLMNNSYLKTSSSTTTTTTDKSNSAAFLSTSSGGINQCIVALSECDSIVNSPLIQQHINAIITPMTTTTTTTTTTTPSPTPTLQQQQQQQHLFSDIDTTTKQLLKDKIQLIYWNNKKHADCVTDITMWEDVRIKIQQAIISNTSSTTTSTTTTTKTNSSSSSSRNNNNNNHNNRNDVTSLDSVGTMRSAMKDKQI